MTPRRRSHRRRITASVVLLLLLFLLCVLLGRGCAATPARTNPAAIAAIERPTTGVPEPASYGLLAGFALLSLAIVASFKHTPRGSR